jgi:hypothetical protein
MTIGKKQGSFAVEGVGASNGSSFETGGGYHAAVTVLASNAV